MRSALERPLTHPHDVGGVARTAVHLPWGIVAGQDAVWVTARKPGSNGQLVRIDPRTGLALATIPIGRTYTLLVAISHR